MLLDEIFEKKSTHTRRWPDQEPRSSITNFADASTAINPETGAGYTDDEIRALASASTGSKIASQHSTDVNTGINRPEQTRSAAPVSSVSVRQINKTIPTLRTRDLQSVKKTVDTVLANKTQPTSGSGVTTTGTSAIAARPNVPYASSTSAGAPSKVTYTGLAKPKPARADFTQNRFTGYRLPMPAVPRAPKMTGLAETIAHLKHTLGAVHTQNDINQFKALVRETIVNLAK